jgi:phosphoenolpyruvate carboxykinase (ATP)
MVNAVLNEDLDKLPTVNDPIFGVTVPVSCPNIPKEVLNQRSTWSNPAEYDAQASKLAGMFIENFKEYAGKVPAEVVEAGPRI